jgi:2-polyprenyl-6-methoxyphenol hydroxylase-like FAD-dependent oxidoreductase
MPAVSRVAIAGGGVAGTATAILLADAGVEVDLFEARDDLAPYGSGITLQGNALRAFRELGVWDEVLAGGYAFDAASIRAPGPDATVIREATDLRTGGPDLPSTVGMYRPDLARILVERAESAGVRVRIGLGVAGFAQDEDGVDVTLSDGSTGRYDLLVGADGLHSLVRKAMGIDTEPRLTGMTIWRAFVRRPTEVVHTELYYGGPCYIAGYCPTSEDSMYAYVVEDTTDRGPLDDAAAADVMRDLAQGYGGPWVQVRSELDANSRVNYTRFTEHVVPAPWNRGRVVVIGDAAHTCPPTLAQGAAQGLEDALVLAERLIAHDKLEQSLWDEFHERRVERATKVVNASVQMGIWMLNHDREANVPALTNSISVLITQPA